MRSHGINSEQTLTEMRQNKGKPAQSKECIAISPGEEEIDDQYTYEVISGTKILQSDFDLLKNPNGWLNRRLINAGLELLKKKFPEVCGLHDVGKMQTGTFEQERSEFVQILHCYESHWVLATNINCKEKQINIYDSNHSGDVSLDTKEAIASMIKTPYLYSFLTFPDVQQQESDSDIDSDCGCTLLHLLIHCVVEQILLEYHTNKLNFDPTFAVLKE